MCGAHASPLVGTECGDLGRGQRFNLARLVTRITRWGGAESGQLLSRQGLHLCGAQGTNLRAAQTLEVGGVDACDFGGLDGHQLLGGECFDLIASQGCQLVRAHCSDLHRTQGGKLTVNGFRTTGRVERQASYLFVSQRLDLADFQGRNL